MILLLFCVLNAEYTQCILLSFIFSLFICDSLRELVISHIKAHVGDKKCGTTKQPLNDRNVVVTLQSTKKLLR